MSPHTPLRLPALVLLLPVAVACGKDGDTTEPFVPAPTEEDTGTTTTPTGTTSWTNPCVAPVEGQVDGQYLLVFSAPMHPEWPIVMTAQVTTRSDFMLAMNIQLQPLDAADRFTPVGSPIASEEFFIGDYGDFNAAFEPFDLPASANATTSEDLSGVSVTLNGDFCDPFQFVCGTANGGVESPSYALIGSTFTMQPMPDPYVLPEVYIDCDRQLADPI